MKVNRQNLQRWYTDALDQIAQARLEEESDTKRGERVFMSHYVSNGRLQHWVLHTHGHKYELRESQPSRSSSDKHYRYNIQQSSFDEEARNASIRKTRSPEVGLYFYSLIGWTALSREQVDQICAQVFDGFGEYNLLLNNCQDFLRDFADRIVTQKAADWDWFRKHGARSYKYSEQPRVHDHVIVAHMWAKQLKQEKKSLKGNELQRALDLIKQLESFVETNTSHTGPDADGDADGVDGGDGGYDGGGGSHDGGGGSHDGGGGHDGGGC